MFFVGYQTNSTMEKLMDKNIRVKMKKNILLLRIYYYIRIIIYCTIIVIKK